MLFLPNDILQHIYEYDSTYREYVKKVVLVEMMNVLKEKVMNEIDRLGNDFGEIYRFLTCGSVNPKMLMYDAKFHVIDQMFFKYHFMERMWKDS